MPPTENLRSRKRRLNCTDFSLELSQPAKKSKTPIEVELNYSHRPPRFWDTLSRIRLSRGAIREFERRTSGNAKRHKTPCYSDRQQINVEKPGHLGRFSRHGGPDLAYLRGFATLATVKDNMSSKGTKRQSAGSKRSSKPKSSPYNGDFEQKLVDNGIYPDGHEHSQHSPSFEPQNLEQIQQALRAPRPSLSPSRFSDAAHREFKRLSARAANEASAMADIIPIIAGEGRRRYNSMTDAQFTNMSPLLEDVTAPKPDVYDGARPEQIDPRVRHSLGSHIVPSKKTNYPAAPNFYLEGKSAAGRADVAKRQACYDGAVGARAMYTLQNYGARQPKYDGNAYSYSNTFHTGTGTLQTYAHHLTRPKASGGRPEYHATQTGAYAMTHDRESFCKGATAFRNGRDLAESHRNAFIENANNVARRALPSPTTTSRDCEDSRSIPNEEQSDTSADELVAELSAQKRHRHNDSMRQTDQVGRPPTQRKTTDRHGDEDVHPKRGGVPQMPLKSSSYAVARDDSKRQPKSMQKLLDSRYGLSDERARPKGRHEA